MPIVFSFADAIAEINLFSVRALSVDSLNGGLSDAKGQGPIEKKVGGQFFLLWPPGPISRTSRLTKIGHLSKFAPFHKEDSYYQFLFK